MKVSFLLVIFLANLSILVGFIGAPNSSESLIDNINDKNDYTEYNRELKTSSQKILIPFYGGSFCGDYNPNHGHIIAWINTTDDAMYIANSSDLITWSNKVKVSGAYTDIMRPDILALSNGSVMITFESGTWPQLNYYTSLSSDLQSWDSIIQATDDNNYEEEAELFELSGGRIGMCYLNGWYPNHELYTRIYTPSSGWGSRNAVFGSTQPYANVPSLVILSNGTWLMAFAMDDPPNFYRILSNNEGVSWTTYIQIVGKGPYLNINTEGTIVNSYKDQGNLVYRTSNDGLSWSEEVIIGSTERGTYGNYFDNENVLCVPVSNSSGTYLYRIIDENPPSGNGETEDPVLAIPFGNFFLLFTAICILFLVYLYDKKKYY